MPLELNGQVYYRTSEVCQETGISRATLFRWISQGILTKLLRDRRGWRLFTETDLNIIRTEVRRIDIEDTGFKIK
jgi:DNA-binding transcriptional MerR regulator